MGAPEPEEIFEKTRIEGERRLERPLLEVVSTALAAGFDIAAGVILIAVLSSPLEQHFGRDAASVVGAMGFGVAFIYLVVGRAELFTENFLVPLAGLHGKPRNAWFKIAELWTVSPVANIVGGGIIALIVTSHGVLPEGSGRVLTDVAQKIHANGTLTLFLSAVFAGALITAMTWFVEGHDSVGIRLTVAWVTGAFLALAHLNHVIVVTIELIFGIRYGAHIPWSFVVGNFFLAAAGNMIGGIGLVTLNRFTQAKAGSTQSA
ncbi:MAG TPA: formate/nitrite transporter family protein [Gaiellaceae bacterium]